MVGQELVRLLVVGQELVGQVVVGHELDGQVVVREVMVGQELVGRQLEPHLDEVSCPVRVFDASTFSPPS